MNKIIFISKYNSTYTFKSLNKCKITTAYGIELKVGQALWDGFRVGKS